MRYIAESLTEFALYTMLLDIKIYLFTSDIMLDTCENNQFSSGATSRCNREKVA